MLQNSFVLCSFGIQYKNTHFTALFKTWLKIHESTVNLKNHGSGAAMQVPWARFLRLPTDYLRPVCNHASKSSKYTLSVKRNLSLLQDDVHTKIKINIWTQISFNSSLGKAYLKNVQNFLVSKRRERG